MTAQLKYIAAYVTAPVSAITHYAPIRSIEPWQNTGKWSSTLPSLRERSHR